MTAKDCMDDPSLRSRMTRFLGKACRINNLAGKINRPKMGRTPLQGRGPVLGWGCFVALSLLWYRRLKLRGKPCGFFCLRPKYPSQWGDGSRIKLH